MNVHDFLKDRTPEEIREYCASKTCAAAIAMVNIDYDSNAGAAWRSVNFFGFKEFVHVQKEGRRINRRPCQGVQNYTPIKHVYNVNELFEYIKEKNYIPVAVENNINYPCKNLLQYVPLRRSIFIFGAENGGLTEEVLDKCLDIVTIPAYGSVRSLNVAATSSIVMAHYRQYYPE
jgi:tRNA G18 (ribose-2'-O)-methylase SpoU